MVQRTRRKYPYQSQVILTPEQKGCLETGIKRYRQQTGENVTWSLIARELGCSDFCEIMGIPWPQPDRLPDFLAARLPRRPRSAVDSVPESGSARKKPLQSQVHLTLPQEDALDSAIKIYRRQIGENITWSLIARECGCARFCDFMGVKWPHSDIIPDFLLERIAQRKVAA